jgi:cell division protein FtsW
VVGALPRLRRVRDPGRARWRPTASAPSSAAGITAWILTQAFVNVGGVVGLLPITGLTLPFISFGGTSLLITMARTGVLVNIARQGRTRRRPSSAPPPERVLVDR